MDHIITQAKQFSVELNKRTKRYHRQVLELLLVLLLIEKCMVSYVVLNYSAQAIAVPDPLMIRSRKFSKTKSTKRKAFKPALVTMKDTVFTLCFLFNLQPATNNCTT